MTKRSVFGVVFYVFGVVESNGTANREKLSLSSLQEMQKTVWNAVQFFRHTVVEVQ